MPFIKHYPRSFNAISIQEHAPAVSGVYGLSNRSEWLFIGETDNIQETLLTHLRQPEPAAAKQAPTGFVFEICDRAQRSGRQDRLVHEYGPTGNRYQPRP